MCKEAFDGGSILAKILFRLYLFVLLLSKHFNISSLLRVEGSVKKGGALFQIITKKLVTDSEHPS